MAPTRFGPADLPAHLRPYRPTPLAGLRASGQACRAADVGAAIDAALIDALMRALSPQQAELIRAAFVSRHPTLLQRARAILRDALAAAPPAPLPAPAPPAPQPPRTADEIRRRARLAADGRL